jgi:ligand-binding sensor protein
MKPMDIKSNQEWENIIERFAQDTQMTACLTDNKGIPLLCRSDRTPLCSAIRDNPEATTSICSQINSVMLKAVERSHLPELDFCDVGLFRIVVPICRGDELVGLVTACGLASREEELYDELVARQLGIAVKQVRELAHSTPVGSKEKLDRLSARLFLELNPAPIMSRA